MCARRSHPLTLMNAGSIRPRLHLTVAFDISSLGLLAGAFAGAAPPWISLFAVEIFSLPKPLALGGGTCL
jgi:hypothetical protein